MSDPGRAVGAEGVQILSSLLMGAGAPLGGFGNADLGAMLRHQMGSRVADALAEDLAGQHRSAEVKATLAGQGIATFTDLFAHDAPPAVVLEEVRRYAQNLMAGDTRGFPTDVARVLYALTELCADDAERGASAPAKAAQNLGRWCLAQTWLDPGTGAIVRRWLA